MLWVIFVYNQLLCNKMRRLEKIYYRFPALFLVQYGRLVFTVHTCSIFEDFWHGFCQKYEFYSAILHVFCKMCAFSAESAAVTGHEVNSND